MLKNSLQIKLSLEYLENFNVSVGIWEDFWNALVNTDDGKYMLRSPSDRKPVKEINAHQLIDLIALSAWKSAEPGLIFFDQINKYNVFAKAREDHYELQIHVENKVCIHTNHVILVQSIW